LWARSDHVSRYTEKGLGQVLPAQAHELPVPSSRPLQPY
jgi:hypothetical protein